MASALGRQRVRLRKCSCLRSANTPQETELVQGLRAQAGAAAAGIANVRANVTQAQFDLAIGQVGAYIAAGDTYQVNYTYASTSMPMVIPQPFTPGCASASV